jgi:hypothetical protein
MERYDRQYLAGSVVEVKRAHYSQITTAAQLNTVIFKDKATAPAGKKFFSLFPGLGYAAGYKVGGISGYTLGDGY